MYEAHVFERQLGAYSSNQQRVPYNRYEMEALIARGRVLRSRHAVSLAGQFAGWLRGLIGGRGKTVKA